ncbi:MAG: hypothetical protein PHT48_08505 [Dechloromonas sp.]|nr:hypothetical protein [Dechloromonas sp.]
MAGKLLRLLLLTWLLLPSGGAWADPVVIVNSRSGIAVMSRSDVINVFFGRNRQFFNGIEAQAIDLLDQHPLREIFYQRLVGKDLAEVNAYWSRQVFSGRMQAPLRAASIDEVLKWVVEHPGGIGFIPLARADARVRVVFELQP